MRTLQYLGVAILAILAFGVITAASASAAGEWLINGVPLTVKHENFAEGTQKFCDDKGGVFLEKLCISCAILQKGSVGPTKTDQIVEVVNSTETSTDIACTNVENCPGNVLYEAQNLPWASEVVMSGGEFKDKILRGAGAAGPPAFVISCSGTGVQDLCEGPNTITLENVAKGVNAIYPPNAEPASCMRGEAASGLIEGTLFTFVRVETLTVS